MFFESPQFGEHFCPKNSSQHQTSTACIRTCRRNRATPPLPRSPVRFLTSTPKPRAEGSSPSAPAKNREASTMLASLFFVSAHKDSATRHGCALRSACRGVSERQWRSAANRPRRQPRQVRCLSMPVFPSVRTRCTSLQHPERTRFRLFRPKPGTFRCFCLLLTCKICGLVFVHCADTPHRLKPSVIPCRREVSFLT